MSELWQTTLFIVIGGWLFTLTMAFAGAMWTLGNRVTRLEATLEIMGNKTILALHSPTNHLNLDGLVEKYVENDHDLPLEDWLTVKNQCEEICADLTKAREDRLIAGLAAAFAEHKLMRFRQLKTIIPP